MMQPNPASGQWVVDIDYAVMSVPDYDEKYSHYFVCGVRLPSPRLGPSLRQGRAHFDTKILAEVHALKLLDISLAECEAKTASLRARREELTGTVAPELP